MSEQQNVIHEDKAAVNELYNHPLARAFLSKVYAWMTLLLAVSAAVAICGAENADRMELTLDHALWMLGGTIVILLLLFFCSGIFTAGSLCVLLLVYSGLMGLIFGPLLLMCTGQSLGVAFVCTAGAFGAMSLCGILTKRDLSPWLRALVMGLFGLIITLVVNYFWGNGTPDLIFSAIGVLSFTLFTACDTQKLLRAELTPGGKARSKGSFFGALSLCLDFTGLSLRILRAIARICTDILYVLFDNSRNR